MVDSEIFSTLFTVKYVAFNIKQSDQLGQKEKDGYLLNPKPHEVAAFPAQSSALWCLEEGSYEEWGRPYVGCFGSLGFPPAKEGASLPPARVICSCGRGWAGVWVQLGHGYRDGASSNLGFSVLCQAGIRSERVIALPSLVWSVLRAGNEKA